jgi:hypothetical protein
MLITLSYVQAFALSALKTAQRDFNKNPNSANFTALSRAMVTHQQAQGVARVLRSQDNIDLMLNKLSVLPLGEWPETIVHSATGVSIQNILNAN